MGLPASCLGDIIGAMQRLQSVLVLLTPAVSQAACPFGWRAIQGIKSAQARCSAEALGHAVLTPCQWLLGHAATAAGKAVLLVSLDLQWHQETARHPDCGAPQRCTRKIWASTRDL